MISKIDFALDKIEYTLRIFVDIMKVFDSMKHDLLL